MNSKNAAALTADMKQGLSAYLTIAAPLGPIAHDDLNDDVASHQLIFDNVEFLKNEMSRGGKPHLLFIGRKGSGKSALLRYVKYRTRGFVLDHGMMRPHKPVTERDFVVLIDSWKVFDDVVSAVNASAPRRDAVLDLELPTEKLAEIWAQQLWHVLIKQFDEIGPKDEQALATLGRVSEYLDPRSTQGEPDAEDLIRRQYLARTAIIALLRQRDSRLYFLFDSMEEYDVRKPHFLSVIRGMMSGLSAVNRASQEIVVSFCLPEEFEEIIIALSSNAMKDFNSLFRIRWKPIELLAIVAHRLRLLAFVRDEELFQRLSALDFTDRGHIRYAIEQFIPARIANACGYQETSHAYVLRHTQLLPRHLIAIFNGALSLHYQASGTFREVTPEAIKSSINAVEGHIATQILTPYNRMYPELIKACKSILPDLNPICTFRELRKIERRFKDLIEKDVGSVWQVLFNMGILGRVAKSSEHYVDGQFHFNIEGNFSMPTDAEFCFHPVFSRSFGIPRREKDKRVVYPAHISLEGVYETA